MDFVSITSKIDGEAEAMVERGAFPGWTGQAIAFLKRELPQNSPGEPGWIHMFSTPYQIGCEALVALGEADETVWGAVPREHARLPDDLPRWDDICVAVLSLIDQHGLIDYRLPDGSVPSPAPRGGAVLIAKGKADAPKPSANIAAAWDMGPARAEPEIISLLEALGLVVEGRWAEAAETVLWRDQPIGWDMDFASDARFLAAVETAVETIPDDTAAHIETLVTITEADVAAALVSYAEYLEAFRAKHPNARTSDPPHTPELARSGLVAARKNALDWLFFRGWRLDDGWLTPVQARRALEIFHDPVAIAMRRAVVARLHPAFPSMAE